ncbi:MAG: FMN-binding negative transcriptional regulator [Rhodospirillaceae bacterium]|nr:FMN-binding negative transcriptional regulator [Rhodospirillaceae bacterium]
MYSPPQFREERIPVLQQAIRELAFGTLVTPGEFGFEASHLPMLMDPEPAPRGVLLGHMARANPQWKTLPACARALAMFVGPNSFITPSWYATKAETGKVVPTWNYIAIHAHGEIEFFDDPGRLREHVSRLTDAHEASRAIPWAVTDAPADYIDKLLGGIVGFKLTIARLEGTWTMSQNRDEPDRAGVHAGLIQEGGAAQKAVAKIMAGQ